MFFIPLTRIIFVRWNIYGSLHSSCSKIVINLSFLNHELLFQSLNWWRFFHFRRSLSLLRYHSLFIGLLPRRYAILWLNITKLFRLEILAINTFLLAYNRLSYLRRREKSLRSNSLRTFWNRSNRKFFYYGDMILAFTFICCILILIITVLRSFYGEWSWPKTYGLIIHLIILDEHVVVEIWLAIFCLSELRFTVFNKCIC